MSAASTSTALPTRTIALGAVVTLRYTRWGISRQPQPQSPRWAH